MQTWNTRCGDIALPRRVRYSIPAEVRERWGASNVPDPRRGGADHPGPVPENPIEAIRGILKGKGRSDISAADAVRQARNEDNAASERKWREYYGE